MREKERKGKTMSLIPPEKTKHKEEGSSLREYNGELEGAPGLIPVGDP